ncbi:short-chain dehydrogenase [Pseudonocardia sp. CNS-139]|nr:short-chain dehydrogenase [Pseudonocardia sp. CNS-139]
MSSTEGLLAGRRIVVTGGASGMGATLVGGYVRAGATVASLDLNPVAGEEVVKAAQPADRDAARFTTCDVTDRSSVDHAFDAATGWLGGLDVLVHAAGINHAAKAEDVTTEDWDRVMAVNATGTLHTNQAAFRALRAGGGAIVNFASGAAVRGYLDHGHYAASKGAVLSWTRTVAAEWGRHGITVNALCPGIRTPMYERTRAGLTPEELARHDAWLAENIVVGGRLGDPELDFLPYLVFLASPGARYITGQTLSVDGGHTMMR